jgi:hypothetical protein
VQDQALFKLADRLQAAKVQQAEDHFTLHTPLAAVVQQLQVQILFLQLLVMEEMVQALIRLGVLQLRQVKTFQEHIGMQAAAAADVKV